MKEITFIYLLILLIIPRVNGQGVSKSEITKKWQLREW